MTEVVWGLEIALRDSQMFVAAVLSHGSEGTFCTREGREYKIERFVENFNNLNCHQLVGVPKFFLFQACR